MTKLQTELKISHRSAFKRLDYTADSTDQKVCDGGSFLIQYKIFKSYPYLCSNETKCSSFS